MHYVVKMPCEWGEEEKFDWITSNPAYKHCNGIFFVSVDIDVNHIPSEPTDPNDTLSLSLSHQISTIITTDSTWINFDFKNIQFNLIIYISRSSSISFTVSSTVEWHRKQHRQNSANKFNFLSSYRSLPNDFSEHTDTHIRPLCGQFIINFMWQNRFCGKFFASKSNETRETNAKKRKLERTTFD